MEKLKNPNCYERPATSLTAVTLESAVCSGSVEVANPDNNPGRIESQTVNTDFGTGNGSMDFGDDGWTTIN